MTPTYNLVAELQRLAEGKLAAPVDVKTTGEIGLLAHSAESLRQGLADIIGRARDSSASVATGSSEMYQLASLILHDAEQQRIIAADMAETMTTLEQTIGEIGDEAEAVRQETEVASQSALAGQQLAEDLISTIHAVASEQSHAVQELNEFVECARNISMLTQQVKDIAAQTNLLALNAAIEASRAGDQGRGFAVVADEVRKLADKSAASAVQIEKMSNILEASSKSVERAIVDSNARLANGVADTGHVSESLATAIDSADKVRREIGAIADAVSQQRRAVEDVARQAGELARQSEQNSVAVRQIHGNLDQMNMYSKNLQESMFVFQVAS